MSSDYAIEVSGLSKCYQIYNRPGDRLLQMLFGRRRKYFNEFWALKDISLQVKKGETVGIIGSNGSGKSTLLQIICGTLNPTTGDIKINGKVAALLELGAGFNPEFTGLENVYMATSLYGLTKEETDLRFDAIATFADIGEHINQPVKTYSSGMYVRLAFAVIAHVDADILVVDEALAVGDVIFTQRCMRFLRKFMLTGTLLFVSHDNASVINLCNKVLWLNKGKVSKVGSAKKVVEAYQKFNLYDINNDETSFQNNDNRGTADNSWSSSIEKSSKLSVPISSFDKSTGWVTDKAKILSVTFSKNGKPESVDFEGGEEVVLEILAVAYDDLESPILGWFVKDRLGQSLFGEHTFSMKKNYITGRGYTIKAIFKFRLPYLQNGEYSMAVSIADGTPFDNIQHHWIDDALIFKVSSNKLRYGIVGIKCNKVVVSRKLINE